MDMVGSLKDYQSKDKVQEEFLNELNSNNVIEHLSNLNKENESKELIELVDSFKGEEEQLIKLQKKIDELEKNRDVDYENIRATLNPMLRSVSNVFTTMVDESLSTADPKQVTAVASLLTAFTNASEKLISFSVNYRDEVVLSSGLFNQSNNKDSSSRNGNTTIKEQNNTQNNYYVSSTEALLNQEKEEKSKKKR
nr:MAG TPA: Terminase DNA packaging enzyme [Caudoviricetes sp.]